MAPSTSFVPMQVWSLILSSWKTPPRFSVRSVRLLDHAPFLHPHSIMQCNHLQSTHSQVHSIDVDYCGDAIVDAILLSDNRLTTADRGTVSVSANRHISHLPRQWRLREGHFHFWNVRAAPSKAARIIGRIKRRHDLLLWARRDSQAPGWLQVKLVWQHTLVSVILSPLHSASLLFSPGLSFLSRLLFVCLFVCVCVCTFTTKHLTPQVMDEHILNGALDQVEDAWVMETEANGDGWHVVSSSSISHPRLDVGTVRSGNK